MLYEELKRVNEKLDTIAHSSHIGMLLSQTTNDRASD